MAATLPRVRWTDLIVVPQQCTSECFIPQTIQRRIASNTQSRWKEGFCIQTPPPPCLNRNNNIAADGFLWHPDTQERSAQHCVLMNFHRRYSL
ncbi:uncharacterized [Tachysurus ichikawai]